MAITPRQLQDAVNSIKCCLPKDNSELLEAICGKLETLIDVISGKEDFELKTISGPKYCCEDGTVYVTFICQKWIDGVFDSQQVIIVGPGPTILDSLPDCAKICDLGNKYIFEKKVCFEDCTEGCVLLQLDLLDPTIPPVKLHTIDHTGMVTEKEIVPCGTFTVLEEEKCMTTDGSGNTDCSKFDTTYSVQNNATDITFSSNSTTLKWQSSTGGNTAGANAFTQAMMDCIDNGGTATVTHLNVGGTSFKFIATGYTPNGGLADLFSGTGVTTGSGKLASAILECKC